ncbi:hypothetical protein ACL02O_17295 [Micromonospora sp. MS34]|uniref:hypothetical protein n=1 Tax=Micromonospora sp. MS34 TaxID=3385971 RepID=UPI0039A160CE
MGRPEQTSWWNTLPGVLTGIAALITAIGALIGALHVIGLFDAQRPAAPSAETTSAGMPSVGHTVGSSPVDASASSTAGPATIVSALPSMPGAMSQGLLTMTGVKSADLESGVVGFALPGQDFLVTVGGSRFSLSGAYMGSYMSPIDSAPRKSDCTAALGTNRLGDVDIDSESVGRWWCVRTGEGHTGAVQVKSVSIDAPQQLVLAYVLWR